MICNLTEIVEELSLQFPVTIQGLIEIPIRSIVRFNPMSVSTLNPDTLYIGTPADLDALPSSQDLTTCPFICVTDHGFCQMDTIRRRHLVMKTVIYVYHKRIDEVVIALAEIMFKIGYQNAPIPELYRELLPCRSIQEMLDRASGHLAEPVLLLDSQGRVSGAAGGAATGLLTEKLRSLCDFYPNIAPLFSWQMQNPSSGGSDPDAPQCFPVEDMYLFLFPMRDEHEQPLGWLLLASHGQTLTPEITENCRLLIRFLAMELLHQELSALPEDGIESFLRSILNAGLSVRAEYEYLLSTLNWQPKQYIYAMGFSNGGLLSSASFNESVEQYTSLLPGSHGVTMVGQVVLVYDTDTPLESTGSQERLKPLTEYLTQMDLHCGISHAFCSIMDLKKYYTQAVSALELGIQFEPATRLHWYNTCAVYHLFDSLPSGMDVNEYICDGIRRLQQYDRDNDSELLKTLCTYLSCRGNVSQCAKQSYLHVSTVKYRINKIEDILQYSLNDGENFFQLYLSAKILQYQQTASLRLTS